MFASTRFGRPRYKSRLSIVPVLIGSVFLSSLEASCPGSASAWQVERSIESALALYSQRHEAYGFSGAVVVVEDDVLRTSSGYGLADRAQGIAFRPGSGVEVGSLLELFLATAVLQLEETGVLTRDDPVSRHLPELPSELAAIEVEDLLLHTSGLAALEGEASSVDSVLAGGEASFSDGALDSAQALRGRRAHSGLETRLLRGLLERVTGRTVADLLRELIFFPSGMTQTGFVEDGSLDPSSWARGYRSDDRTIVPGDAAAAPHRSSDPRLMSSASELLAWALSLEQGRLLSPDRRTELLLPRLRLHDGRRIGYGGVTFDPDETTGGWTVWNRVRDRGFGALLHVNAAHGRVVLITSNMEWEELSASEAALALADGIYEILGGTLPQMPPAYSIERSLSFAHYAGRYRLDDSGEEIEVRPGPEPSLRFTALGPMGRSALELADSVAEERVSPLENPLVADRLSRALAGDTLAADTLRSNPALPWRQARFLSEWLAHRRLQEAPLGPPDSIDVFPAYRGIDAGTVVTRLHWIGAASDSISLRWRGGRLVGATADYPIPRYRGYPRNEGEFTLYDPVTKRSTSVSFAAGPGDALSLRIQAEPRPVSATRVYP